MKRVKGTQGVALMECINADMNKWSVRWDVHEESAEEGRDVAGVNYMEATFFFKPDLSDVQAVMSTWCASEEPEGCFVLDGKNISLDREGILMLRDQANEALEAGEETLPLITDAGVVEIAPAEAVYIAGRMAAYYSAYRLHINARLAAIEQAGDIDALTALDFRSGYPQPDNLTLDEVRAVIQGQKPTLQEQAISFARMAINAVELADSDALAVKDLHPKWETFIGKAMKAKTRVTYGERLFRARQDINPVLDIYPPGSQGTEALYEEINETNAGTLDDPIPYNNNMELFAGKYYSQGGVVYKCTRDTGQAVYQDLADLVGIYVEVAE